ncbi:ATP-binding protein [Polyangium sp. y55x31]|uniref:HAMP domain-containing sensor histidine kinase n=1 Tax=Polyangium sp. y55x31 TaxID=3042688 RepID=UPI0024829FC5|nr:ATP-binding protein [Polyangium sp. y55x31]MDI1483904.1 ATP-binding protein [Polyangium sp. y55x31]
MIGRLGIRAKLIIASVVLMLVAGFAIERFGSRSLEALMIERTTVQLTGELRLCEDIVRRRCEASPCAEGHTLDALADELGTLAGGRITLIAPGGAVLGDSELTPDEISRTENHASREEVASALGTGTGSAFRYSGTLGQRMIYAARRYPKPEQGVSVVRIAVPLTGVDAAIGSARLFLLVGIAVAIAAAVAMSAFGTYLLTRPVRSLTEAALAMAGGNLAIHAPAQGTDETAQLGRALNRLSSELLAAIEELRDERDLLASILDGMNEGVLVTDGDARIVLANRALRGMTLVGEGTIGKSVIEVIRNASLQEALDRAAASSEAVVREVELSGLLPRKLLVRVSKLPSRKDRDRQSTNDRGLIAVFHDVTDLRRLETIRTDFVANVSHELRTPVTAISTAAETLLAGALAEPEEAAEFVDVIDRHAKRLRQLVDDLLDLSKIESKNYRLKLVEQDVIPAVTHVTRLLDEAARRRKVELRIERPEGPLPARIDRRAMEQVLMNLCDNATKYAGEGAHVVVTARPKDGGGVEIRVKDDGPGIPPAHLGRIFERFYRVDAGRSRDLGGTGLGLSIVKHLVELMNGTIDVESELGKGSTFTVRLPPTGERQSRDRA